MWEWNDHRGTELDDNLLCKFSISLNVSQTNDTPIFNTCIPLFPTVNSIFWDLMWEQHENSKLIWVLGLGTMRSFHLLKWWSIEWNHWGRVVYLFIFWCATFKNPIAYVNKYVKSSVIYLGLVIKPWHEDRYLEIPYERLSLQAMGSGRANSGMSTNRTEGQELNSGPQKHFEAT